MIATDPAGQIKVDGQLLPGIFQGIDIGGSLRVDSEATPGKSGNSKRPMGFDDATVTIKLKLPTDDDYTCHDRLKALVRIFRAVDSGARPYVRRIVDKHCAAWGISEVLFQDLRTSEDNQSDHIMADLVFTEWQPTVVKREQAVSAPKMADFNTATAAPAPASPRPPTPAVDDDVVAVS